MITEPVRVIKKLIQTFTDPGDVVIDRAPEAAAR